MTDIEGSTRLLQQLGPGYGEILLRHRRIIRDAAAAHSGTERSTEGDSFFITFPAASDAVAAALEAQRALYAQPWPVRDGLRVRMGVHLGEIEEIADTIVGMSVHEAARITNAAHGGQVLCSETVTRLTQPPPRGDWIDLGEHSLKDLATPIRLAQLVYPGLPTDFPPIRSQRAAPRHLPAQPSSFVGRQHELAELTDLIARTGLVTVTGPGGAGKTRLALRAAADMAPQFPDGTWFVDLSTTSDPGAVTRRMAAELGVPQDDEPWEYLVPRRALLLLDNCEHLVDAVAELTSEILSRCPSMAILATSREPIGAQGEIVWRVPPMTPKDAFDLLVARAQAVNPRFDPGAGNQEALRSICERLDALPLALELAAARTASLSPEQISARLTERFRLLVGGARGAASRHRTLQATVDWSYELLAKEEQRALQRAGVFAGGFTLEAFEQVCMQEPSAGVDVLDRLVAKSLLIAEQTGSDLRYRLLETVRQYALDRLAESEGLAEARTTHASYFGRLASAAEAVLLWEGGDEHSWLARLDLEVANVTAALEWWLDAGELNVAAQVLFGVMGWLIARGRSREGLAWAQRIQAMDPVGEELALSAGAAMMFWSNLGPIPWESVRLVDETASLLRGTRRSWLEPIFRAYVAAWSYPQGDTEAATRAVPMCELAVDAARSVGEAALGMALQPLLWVKFDGGDLDAARHLAQEGLTHARRSGLRMLEGRMAVNLSRIVLAQGDLEEAWDSAELAVGLARGTGEPFVVVAATEQLVSVAERRQEPERAAALLASILDAVAEIGSPDDLNALRRRMNRFEELASGARGETVDARTS